MAASKEFLTFSQQVKHLKFVKQLDIANEKSAEELLQRIGYQHLPLILFPSPLQIFLCRHLRRCSPAFFRNLRLLQMKPIQDRDAVLHILK
ncbi:MAG: hypothetical protein U0N90_14490 [Blautia sp.]|jgi:abortive infection bacteriophage resistance protein